MTALTTILCRHLSGDAGNPPSDAIALCGDQLSKTVFTTSHYYDGDLKTAGGGATGLEGADNICNATARGAGLAGTYTAWLSDSITGARDRVTHSNIPYKRTDGALIANNFADLTDGTLVNPLEYNEFGILIGYGHAWTNTRQDGLRFKLNDPSLTCNDWTNNTIDGQPVVGHLDDFVSGNWTLAETGFPCSSQEVRLYCFQD